MKYAMMTAGRLAAHAKLLMVLILLLYVQHEATAAAAADKWTIFIYMLADNDLEEFGLLDLEEVMKGMAAEPLGGCSYSSCNALCPSGTTATYITACVEGDAASGTKSRCCPTDSYPDVLLLVDRGQGQVTSLSGGIPYADYSLLNNEWTSARELLALPGAQWQQLKDYGELDLADPNILSAFLQRGLARFPPSDGRNYMLVFWDHGSGWAGYGVDHTCQFSQTYSQKSGCNMLTMQTLAQGLDDGLKDPVTNSRVMLDIIGFDACLMAMYEIGSALAPYSKYLLASELLEPGHGWDYAAPLQGIIQQRTAEGLAVNTMTTKHVADLVIKGYIDQATYYQTSGLTLALLDLGMIVSSMESRVTNLFDYLSSRIQAPSGTPGNAIELLRKRATLSTISGAEDNVDLGALLASFVTLPKTSFPDPSALVSDAASFYAKTVVSFQKDAELEDGTGMAIYFPSDSAALAARYEDMVNFDPTALRSWDTFLGNLYAAIARATEDAGEFDFIEALAVPYLAVTSNTWVVHGTLTNSMGLTANLLYGFRTPSGTEFITAGAIEAAVVDRSAVGVWSGYLFGLIQDLVQGDNAVDGLALAYADEQRVIDANKQVKQLILQIKVYYAPTCYSASTDMRKGTLKYVYDTTSAASTMQLFVKSNAGSWGEVPAAQGGVVIPYLGSYALTGTVGTIGVSFGYSDCLKWGYANKIQLAAFDPVQAADILGLNLARDMETQLVVNAYDGATAAISGRFMPAQKTLAGCQCSQMWTYTSENGTKSILGTCINPKDDPKGAWCVYEPDSCTSHNVAPANVANSWDYCAATMTLSGCKCHPSWSLKGKTYYGTCTDDGDSRGSWCVVDRASCPGAYRAHQYGADESINATINGRTGALTGLDFDYCQVTTLNGCHCRNTWTYGGTTYHGTCRQGLDGDATMSGISADTNWCYVESSCTTASGYLSGYKYDICTSEGGRVTNKGVACELPALHNGAVMYDCLTYNQTSGATSNPWCYTNQTTKQWDYCAPWSCSAALKQRCPASAPVAGSDLSHWATSSCLESLCNSRQAMANISQCSTDLPQDLALLNNTYRFLSGSTEFGQALKTSTGHSLLSAYCNAKFGQLCVDEVTDQACPALYRNDNTWYFVKDKSQLCDMGCLTALCQLQEQAKSKIKGTSSWQSAMATARGFSFTDTTCADDSVENLVRWVLMQNMDQSCNWSVPTNLMCNRLLSPPQQCQPSTVLDQSSGTISDGVPAGGYYSASSSCNWTINLPDQPYITLNFTSFDTEALYDVVTVEDFDGVIGMFSGNEVPSALSTDTGLIKVQFTSDGTKEGHGFSASFAASAAPQVKLPTCTGDDKLIQAVLRTRQYGAELSWLVTMRNILSSLNAPSQLNIVMAGGLLPASVRNKVPSAVAAVADVEYKDYRSYYSYVCLPTGDYNIVLYDSYGDGWDNGRITITQLVNATTGCELVYATTTSSNKTVPFEITADAGSNSAACSSLASQSLLSPFFVDAGLVVLNEDPTTFIQAKQRKIKEALALLLDVDASQVSIRDIKAATPEEIAAAKFAVTMKNSDAGAAGSSASDSGDTLTPKSGDGVLLAASDRAQSDARVVPGTIQHMLEQQHQPPEDGFTNALPQMSASSKSMAIRRQLLAQVAKPVSEALAAGEFDIDRQLLEAQLLDQRTTADQHKVGEQNDSEMFNEGGSCTAEQALSGCDVDDSSRKLQQLLILDDEGEWQSSIDTSANQTNSTSDVTAVLSANPLLNSKAAKNGSVSPLVGRLSALLQPNRPVGGPKPVFSKNARKPSTVSLAVSFRDAFAPKPVSGISSTIQGDFGISSFDDDAAGSPGTVTGGQSNTLTAVAAGAAQPAIDTDTSAAVPMFGAIRPARSLIETENGQGSDAISSAVGIASAAGKHLDQAQQQQQQQSIHTSIAANSGVQDPNLKVAGGPLQTFIDEGREKPNFARPRPPPIKPRHATLEKGQHTDIGKSRMNGVDATVQRRFGGNSTHASQRKRPTVLFGTPKTHIRHKPKQHFNPTAVHHVPELLQSAQGGGQPEVVASISSRDHRQLLASSGNTTKGLLIVARVSGFRSNEAATAAAATIELVVTNGTLRNTLAAQGYSGVDVGLAYTTTGMRIGAYDTTLQTLIIAVASGGGAMLAVILIGVWYVRRVRRRAAAQVPGAQSAGKAPSSIPATRRPSVTGPSGGSYSAGAGRYSPAANGHPSGHSQSPQSNSPPVQGRSRSSSLPVVVPEAAGVFANRGHSMVPMHGNPFMAAGGSPTASPLGQYAASPSPRAQPWFDTDTANRVRSYSPQPPLIAQQQQQYRVIQQQQQQYWPQQPQQAPVYSPVDRIAVGGQYQVLQPYHAHCNNPQQAARSPSPAFQR